MVIATLLVLTLFFILFPFGIWFRNNLKKVKETYSFRDHWQLKLSWIICYSIAFGLIIVVVIISFFG